MRKYFIPWCSGWGLDLDLRACPLSPPSLPAFGKSATSPLWDRSSKTCFLWKTCSPEWHECFVQTVKTLPTFVAERMFILDTFSSIVCMVQFVFRCDVAFGSTFCVGSPSADPSEGKAMTAPVRILAFSLLKPHRRMFRIICSYIHN